MNYWQSPCILYIKHCQSTITIEASTHQNENQSSDIYIYIYIYTVKIGTSTHSNSEALSLNYIPVNTSHHFYLNIYHYKETGLP